MAFTAENIKNLDIADVNDEDLGLIKNALAAWTKHYDRNVTRSIYFDIEQEFKDLGLALPPQLKNAEFYLGWCSQAVLKPALRTQFQDIRMPGSDDPFEMRDLLYENRFRLEFSQGVIGANTHGVSFFTLGHGDVGEPDVLIQGHSAEYCGAVFNPRNRRLKVGVTISEFAEKNGQQTDVPQDFNAYLPGKVIRVVKSESSDRYVSETYTTGIDEPSMVPAPIFPQIRRPLGRSRLTNSVMSLNDMAVRGYVRMEGNAEFYSFPQIAILGLNERDFGEGGMTEYRKMKIAMDRIMALTKDEDGDVPQAKQFQQATMSPHSEMIRTVAMAFSGETGIPPSSLGIIHDQPSSAEAIRAAFNDMILEVNYQNDVVHSQTVMDVMRVLLKLRDGKLPDDLYKASPRFADPEFRSMSAQADAITKMGNQMDDLVQYPVLLESVFDTDSVDRLIQDGRRARGRKTFESMMQGGVDADEEPDNDVEPPESEDSEEGGS